MALLTRLRRRRLRPEWMDQPGLDEGQHRQALRGLERINRLSGSARILWPPLARLARLAREVVARSDTQVVARSETAPQRCGSQIFPRRGPCRALGVAPG